MTTANDTLPEWARRVIDAHLAVCDQVSHGARMNSDRYFVWQEDGATDMAADDGHGEAAVTGTTDLFTKREFDPWAAALGEAFETAGLAWYLNSVQYEEKTGFWHYEWVWEVA